jgi:hypothetical protein
MALTFYSDAEKRAIGQDAGNERRGNATTKNGSPPGPRPHAWITSLFSTNLNNHTTWMLRRLCKREKSDLWLGAVRVNCEHISVAPDRPGEADLRAATPGPVQSRA